MNIKELINVSKPARYIGGELNSIMKDNNNLLDFCLIFPDIYEIGSSHIGYKLLYERVNKSDKVYCQRFFVPWKDALDYFGKNIVVPIYIVVDDGLRLERALIRERQQKNPNYMELCRRFLADEKDFSLEKLKICGIHKIYENNDLEQCIMEIKKKLS